MKIHIGLNVTNLDASLVFYSKIFGTKPVKVKQDYVKFLLEDPGLNFTLRQVDRIEGNHINHFGFQIYSTDELNQHKERLEKEGFFSRSENNTTCCYARQDKFWITDPDGHEWEFFLTKEDTEVDTVHTCCG